MLTVLVILLSLGVLIGIHELSHMIVSKLFGVDVLKFSFGFGPKLLSYKFHGTSYELRLLPLGGFVQMRGEDPAKMVKHGFFSISWWKRSLIALAGPTANLFLGFLIIVLLLIFGKEYPIVPALKKAFELSSLIVVTTVKYLVGFFYATSHASDMSGPIGITKLMAQSIKESWTQFCFLLSVISLSLGLFNLFPIPGLDGAHVSLYAVEGILRRKLPKRVYEIWNIVGMVLLGSLMLFTIFLDLVKK